MAIWAAVAVLPKKRQTVVDLVRRLSGGSFLRPTAALAGATAALAVGVGFLPLIGARDGLSALATGAIVSVLAAAAALIQPRIGRARDDGKLRDRTGMIIGLVLAAAGIAAATVVPGIAGLVIAAAMTLDVGLLGIGLVLVVLIGLNRSDRSVSA